MAYKYSKGKTYQGDIYNEDDAERNTYIDFGDDDYIGLVASGSSVLVVSGSAVGIGTTTPDHELAVVGNISASSNISASFYYGDGSTLSNVGGGGSPGGSDTQVQFNDHSSFGGDSNFTWDEGAQILAATNITCSANVSSSVVHVYNQIHHAQSVEKTSDFTIGEPMAPLYRVDTSSSVVTASLPSLIGAYDGLCLNIKDVGLSASTNHVVLKPNGSDTIDGASGLKIQADGGCVGLQGSADESNWYIIFTT